MKMKILMVITGLDIGGAETHVVELSKELKRRGHDVAIVSGGGAYVSEIEAFGIKHHTVSMASKMPLSMWNAVKSLKRIFIAEKPDIVHAHARVPAFLTGFAHRALMKKSPFVFVTTVHGAFSTAFPLKLLSDWGDMSLAVSDDLKKYLIDNYGISEENINVSINGIDMQRFSPAVSGERAVTSLGVSDKSKKIVCVTRLDRRVCSHAGWLMDILPEIDKRVSGVEYILVGDGDAYASLLEKSKVINDILGRRAIVLAGARTDVNEILACADVCVGVSRAILEPMAMGKKCVVAGEWGYIGVPDEQNLDMAKDCNFTCRGCDAVDTGVLADDIVRLLTCSDEQGKSLGEFNRSVIQRYYSASKMADDNEQLYHTAKKRYGRDAVILGYYGFKNCGDDALLGAIINDLRKIDEDFGINVLSNNPSEITRLYEVSSSNRFSFSQVKRAISSSKLFILGGGSLIQDVTSSKSLWYYLACACFAKRVGTPVMLYANGIGPVVKKVNRYLTRMVLNGVDCITLRDRASYDYLVNERITKPRLCVTADPAFGIAHADVDKARQLLEKYGVPKDFVCMSTRSLIQNKFDSSFVDGFASMSDYIIEKHSLTPVFVAMQYKKDKNESIAVVEKMNGKGIFIDEELDAGVVLGLISLSKAVVAVRLHMLIFGTLFEKPVFGIAYDPKVSSFAKLTDNRFCVSPSELVNDSYKALFDEFVGSMDLFSASMREKLPDLKQKAFENAQIAVSIINK